MPDQALEVVSVRLRQIFDKDRFAAWLNPSFPSQMHGDDFLNGNQVFQVSAIREQDGSYIVQSYVGSKWHQKTDGGPLGSSLALEDAIQLMDHWSRTRESGDLQKETLSVIGAGAHYKKAAAIRHIALSA